MFTCNVCGAQHPESPRLCKEKTEATVHKVLVETFAQLLRKTGDTPVTRLMIANYTVGYMGATFGLHIPS
jgi:hypothetical protein